MQRVALFLLALSLPSLAPAAKPHFEEDFSGGPESIEKWIMKDRSFWTVTKDGHLASSPPPDLPAVGCRSPRFKGRDLKFTFDFKIGDSHELQFKINHVTGGHICRFIVKPSGFHLRVNTNKVIPIPKAFDMDAVAMPVAPRKWHTMTIAIDGDAITGSIPGVGSKTYHSSYFDNAIGSFGLAARGASIFFDNFRIEHGEPGPGASGVPFKRNTGGTPVSQSKWLANLEPFFQNHCYDCHDDEIMKGDLDLFTLSTDLTDAETLRRWVRVFDRVKKGEMPPEKKPRPEEADKTAFLASLESPLITGHRSQRETVLRRLNRAEYQNTIEDLFGIEIRLEDRFPADAKKYGFDNNGEGLTLSAELVELYLEAANLALDRALGPDVAPEKIKIDGHIQDYIHDNMYTKWQKLIGDGEGTVIYSSEFGAGSQMNHLKLPSPGTYRARFHCVPHQTEDSVMMQIQTGVTTRQGNKRFMGYFEIPPEGRIVEITDYMVSPETFYPRPFGTLGNISAFIGRSTRTIHDYKGAGLRITRFELEGPIDPWPVPSRKKLLGNVDLKKGTAADAEVILTKFLPRAFRRPVADGEIEKYFNKVASLIESGRTFEESLRWTLTAALCSPDFLFLEEPVASATVLRSPSSPAKLEERRRKGEERTDPKSETISDFALANRLSYYLWSTMPDAELTRLATQGKLHEPGILHAQVDRLLKDNKAKAFTRNFAHQWLHLRDIDATSPDTKLFPEFDDYLKHSMVHESEAFFENILRNNGTIRAFIDSNWVMVNERLAEHYDIPDVRGAELRRVVLAPNSPRGGIMTQASVLKVTANGANTSPVERGVWILENLLGIHPPPPPPSVPAVVPDVTGANTLRQLLDAHRNEESCNTCHRIIDPPGFALENFDPVGAWRTRYAFQGSKKMLPVDATGATAEGVPFRNINQYKKIVLKDIDQVTYGLTEKLLTYGTGRAMGFSDRNEIHAIVSELSKNNYGFRDLVHATVQSRIFHQP